MTTRSSDDDAFEEHITKDGRKVKVLKDGRSVTVGLLMKIP